MIAAIPHTRSFFWSPIPRDFSLHLSLSMDEYSVTGSGQLYYHVTTPSFGSQPNIEGKIWTATNQICGIQKDRQSWRLSVALVSLV